MGQTTSQGVGRLFTPKNSRAYDQFKWARTNAVIENRQTSQSVFEQKNVEFPEGWSKDAINITAQQYFDGNLGEDDREYSLKQLIDRVVDTITRQGQQEGYFESATDAEDFREELKFVLASQKATFGAPVWTNIGSSSRKQQASSSFILSVQDNMSSILNWYAEESAILKGSSASGVNLSSIRSSIEPLGKSGGLASGPLSFLRGADASFGTIKGNYKSVGVAKKVILDVDHPDIEEFIWSKAIEERKARDLESMGWNTDPDGKESFTRQYQNTEMSVRVTDEFMEAAEADKDWQLKAVTSGQALKVVKAKEIFKQIAAATWESTDPGIQFDSTINLWNTTPIAGRINSSSAYGEYMHLDDSACNLASINLLNYLNDDLSFAIEEFKHTVDLIVTAQEILVGLSDYPTKKITQTARAYRELGIGYSNLGALLMAQSLPYDSEDARAQAAVITALMTGHAYAVSAKLARQVGPFSGFNKDREGMLNILRRHRETVSKIDVGLVSEDLLDAAASAWDEAVELGELYGVRNSQVSLLAANNVSDLMMGSETMGIEPYIGKGKTIKTADDESDLVSSDGDNTVHYMGHVKMMAAVQPFLSGAIGKTVTIPEDATVEEVERLIFEAWKMGLKSITVYRNNWQVSRPLNQVKQEVAEEVLDAANEDKIVLKGAVRRTLPRVRKSRTYKFQVSDLEGYFTVGEYDDGTPGELFVNVSKQGSTLSGLADSFAISVSNGLQYGVPLKRYAKALRGASFAPSGITDDPEIRTASSVIDYIMRRLALDYLSFDDLLELGLVSLDDLPDNQLSLIEQSDDAQSVESAETKAAEKSKASKLENTAKDDNAPLCFNCGNQTRRSGSCYVCVSCGSTTGCS